MIFLITFAHFIKKKKKNEIKKIINSWFSDGFEYF
jgi:hypothetical protein